MSKLTIVIVGGVAGGASAAARARRMNEQAEIILLEKDEYVSFANCGLPYYIGGEITDREDLIVTKPELLIQRFRLDVRTRHEALSIDRANRTLLVRDRNENREYEQAYDKLILRARRHSVRAAGSRHRSGERVDAAKSERYRPNRIVRGITGNPTCHRGGCRFHRLGNG